MLDDELRIATLPSARIAVPTAVPIAVAGVVAGAVPVAAVGAVAGAAAGALADGAPVSAASSTCFAHSWQRQERNFLRMLALVCGRAN